MYRSCWPLQVLKLQESPDAVPKGELPRHMQLYCDRYLTDKVVPGNRVTVMGVYSIRKATFKSSKVPCGPAVCNESRNGTCHSLPASPPGGRRPPVLASGDPTCGWWALRLSQRVPAGPGAPPSPPRRRRSCGDWLLDPTSMMSLPNPLLLPSTAASVSVSLLLSRVGGPPTPALLADIKKAIACLLFGGSRKRYLQIVWLVFLT